LLIGFESLSAANLANANKAFNNPQQYIDVVNKLHDYGLGVDGSFVLGFDNDDVGVFERTADFGVKAKIDVCYFSILTPYPGTVLHTKMVQENRIIDTNWSNYNTNSVVFTPKMMKPEELLDGFHSVLKQAFSYPSIVKRLWGTSTYKQFFYPMNFGFRQTILKTIKHKHHITTMQKADG
jgi:radical SAM superfamily enzyme YgiQ (UPF0313 family)